MSDFDDIPEIDPAAEFLAREQNELAGLEDEVQPAAASVAATTLTSNGVIQVENHPSYLESDVFNSPPQLSDSPTSMLNKQPKEEPEKIRKWREEQIARLEIKDREEEIKKEELRQCAKHELEHWCKTHADVIAKTKQTNREAEKQFVTVENDMESGHEWDSIAKLCDFNQKAKSGNKDVTRMRSIILQLKQQTSKA